MDMYNIKWTRLQAGIFRLMCIRAGQNLSLRGIARLLKVSPTAISNALAELEKEGLIISRKSKEINLLSIGFNRDSSRATGIKRAENLRMIYESGLHDFLFNEFPGCAIVMFGSYSKGEDMADSDVDIAVIGSKGKDANTARFEKVLERKLSMSFYESWAGIHRNLRNNIAGGIILKGSVEM